MASRTLVLLGTRKGAFILELDAERERVTVGGPFCETMPIAHLAWDPLRGALLAGAGSPWYGPIVWRSPDLGQTWTQSSEGLRFEDSGADVSETSGVERIWNLTPAGETVYAGVEPAGLFRSDDGGVTWAHVSGLREHPSRPTWQASNGGLMLHSIVPHPTDADRMWVAISSVGVFHTADAGATWEPRNHGVRALFAAEEHVETSHCIHKLVQHPDRPDTLFQQSHTGVYRSDDGGTTWVDGNEGLPSTFGFPIAVHPREPETIWTVPLNGDDQGRFMPGGRAAVWQSQDGGESWAQQSEGLPPHDAYLGVLREGMAVDQHDPAGVYIGTSTGQLFGSRDEGRSWRLLADFLPGIASVEIAQLED